MQALREGEVSERRDRVPYAQVMAGRLVAMDTGGRAALLRRFLVAKGAA